MTFRKWVRTCNEGEELWNKYKKELETMSAQEIIAEFISYLDVTEESDNGIVFNPISIDSCRVMMIEPINEVLKHMRRIAYD